MTVLQVARGAMPEADRGDMRWLVALLEAERDLVFQVPPRHHGPVTSKSLRTSHVQECVHLFDFVCVYLQTVAFVCMRWLVVLLEAERDLVFQVSIQIDR